MSARLMAIVAEGDRGRVYLAPTTEHEEAALEAKPEWKPDVEFFQQALGFRIGNYGMTKWSDLFTDRQLVALTTFADLVQEGARAGAARRPPGRPPHRRPSPCATAVPAPPPTPKRLGFTWRCAVDRMADTLCTIARWTPERAADRHCLCTPSNTDDLGFSRR